jgi:hypothetical protein
MQDYRCRKDTMAIDQYKMKKSDTITISIFM